MSRVPRIRFKGFEEDWEQRKLSEIAFRVSNLRLSSSDLPCVEYEDVVSEAGILNNDIRSKKVVKAGILFDDTHVLYGKLRPYLHNWLCPDFSGVAVGDWWVLKPCYVAREFIYRIIQTKRFDNATNQSSGSKMPRADWNLVSNTEFMISSDSSEQEKIGLYFKKLDHLITLHQRKLEKLKIIKKSMLENLFPQNGEKTPKIRFSGYTKDWEQRKLGDYLEVSEEKNLNNEYTKENVLSVSGDVGIVNQIEFQGRSFAGILVNNYGVVKTGYVVYTKSPLKNNPYGIIKANKGRDGIVSTLYAIYKPKVNVNSNFIQIYFEQNARMNNYMQPLVNKGAKNDMKISSENALKGNVIFPIRKEQDIIVDLFFKIDHLITLHQSKLEKLQKIKKSMLESMFV